MIHIDLILYIVCGNSQDIFIYFLHMDIYLFLHHLLNKQFFPPMYCFGTFVENQLTI